MSLISRFAAHVAACVLLGSFQHAAAAVSHARHLSFDGSNDVVTAPHHAAISLTSQVTVEAWIKPRSLATGSAQDRVVSKGGNYELTLATGDTGCAGGTQGAVQWRATIGGIDARICGGQLALNEWHHIAGTYDGSTFALYVDGERVAVMSRSGAVTTNATVLTLGNRPTLDRALDGALDEVRIWRRARTQSELQVGSESSLSGTEVDLVAYYRLDETSGQSLFDATAQANHAALGATAAAESSDPVRIQESSNTAPQVAAGSDQLIYWPSSSVQLSGTVQDDGLPTGTLNAQWTAISGPAGVAFQNAAALQTTASFPASGVYQLRLEVSDGELTAADTMEVTVATQQSIASLEIHPRFVTLAAGETQQFWVTARDGAGNTVGVSPSWTASSGTISAQGAYVVPSQTGLHTITANANGVVATAHVDAKPASIWPTAGWTSATPSELGMDAQLLAQARDYALTGAGSGMIARGGRLATSWGSATTRYDIKSSTKSIGATALGLAVQDGRIALGDMAQVHLPSLGTPPSSNTATGWLDDITVLHLATQSAGFDKPGGYTSLLFEPGTQWSYSDGGANWLADVLTNVFAADLHAVLFSRAFTRMGITSADLTWRSNAYREDTLNGVKRRELGSGIFANVNALARIGYLYLRRGLWEGQRILPDEFIEQVQRPAEEVRGLPSRDPAQFPQASSHYAVLWWTNADSTLPEVPRDAYWSWGLGDSLMVVIPSLDIVATRAGNGWRSGWDANYAYLDGFLTPLVRSVLAKIAVPQTVGQTQSAARRAIEQAGLAVSGVTQQSSGTVAAGSVISQAPTAGTLAARNTGVRLVVSSGASSSAVPQVVGLTQSAAQSAITQAGFTVGNVVQQTSATVEAGRVISQSPAGGATAPSGSQVHLWISSGSPTQQARLSFDGVNDVATIAHHALLTPARLSVEAWIAPRTLANSNSQDRLISKSGSYELTLSTGDTGCAFGTSGAVQWRLVLGGVDARICGGQVSLDTWQYVVGTYDGSSARLYIDGVLVASANRGGAVTVTAANLLLGNRATLDRAYDGAMDEVRIWRRALSSTEVRDRMQQAPSATDPDLIAWYRFDEAAGQVLNDASANALNGARGTNTSTESSDPAWIQ